MIPGAGNSRGGGQSKGSWHRSTFLYTGCSWRGGNVLAKRFAQSPCDANGDSTDFYKNPSPPQHEEVRTGQL